MALRTIQGLASALALACACQTAIAQQTPATPATPTTPAAQEKPKETAAKPDKVQGKSQTKKAGDEKKAGDDKKAADDTTKADDKPEPKPLYNLLSVGYGGRNIGGNRTRLFQYAEPPTGFGLFELGLLKPWDPKTAYGRLLWRGDPWEDYAGQGILVLRNGNVILRGAAQRSDYEYPTWKINSQDEERLAKFAAQTEIGRYAGAFYSYRSDKRDENLSAPLDGTHFYTQTHGLGFEGRVLGGVLGLNFVNNKFIDHSGLQPDAVRNIVSGRYGADLTNSVSLDGSATVTHIEQPGFPNGNVKALALGTTWDLDNLTTAELNFGRDDFDFRQIANAYAQKRLTSNARVNRRWTNGSFQIAYKYREDERVRADHSFVDLPRWDTYEARLYQRLTHGVKLSVRASSENMHGHEIMLTDDPRLLSWTDRTYAQAKIDGGNEANSAFASYTYRYRRNTDRQIEIAWHNLSAGFSRSFLPTLTGFTEFGYDTFGVHSAGELTPSNFNYYFPDSIGMGIGLDWARTPKQSFAASFNYAQSTNSRLVQLTLQSHTQIAPNRSLDLVFAPWKFDDREYDLTGYRATMVQVRYTTRF